MRILGLDYGDVRMGFAISDSTGTIAMPLCVVDLRQSGKPEDEVKRICIENNAKKLVVGLPLNMNGSSGPMAKKIDAFISILKANIEIPIEKMDERLSTSLVERVLIQSDMSRAKRKRVRDKLAAQVILQGYLDMNNIRVDQSSVDEQV